MKLTDDQKKVMQADGHLLVTGGPGSGKTTISILKAAKIAENNLCLGQKILFLSFARATISRVLQAIEYEKEIPLEQKRCIVVETYHSFFWRILRTHGYLVGLPRRLKILNPSDEAIALSNIRLRTSAKETGDEQKNAEKKEQLRLAIEEGRVCFDQFAHFVGDILHGSERIRRLIGIMFPFIILDEFQDTNSEQWSVVQALGACCRLNALADPEQRIHDWIGADPARLNQFRETFAPIEVDLGTVNHRSAGTEIVMFGDDLLAGKFRQEKYNGIVVDYFRPFAIHAMTKLVTTVYQARKRLVNQNITDWSLAVLVPTKKMTRLVSEALSDPHAGKKEVPHTAIIDMEAAILGAEVIAFLMQPFIGNDHFENCINLICNYFQGKGGNEPTKKAIKEADNIRKAYNDWVLRKEAGKTIRQNSILVSVLDVYEKIRAVEFIGVPDKDWLSIRDIMEQGACIRLKEIAKEARNVRLLNRGAQLRKEISQNWIDNGAYLDALSITRQAFMRQHFLTSAKPETGVIVMNMHKAKGKQFDEVIIFEGWPIIRPGQPKYNPDRIVRYNSEDNNNNQARQNLRVSVTRAMNMTTILTPLSDPCVLL